MSTDGFETIAKLRAQYTDEDDLADIKNDEDSLKALLEAKDYAAMVETQRLTGVLRDGVVSRRLILATDNTMTDLGREKLFAEIAARLDVLNLLTKDFDAEIAQMERILLSRLNP